ncbi:hypothetical protein AB0H71_09920 [Nocardia sp. NPDC050697]|uniref:hypothetical protein n=1 Tax=Nocardia sp. NPDC050697 TaxID=3155158 RepID=UPI0033F7463D
MTSPQAPVTIAKPVTVKDEFVHRVNGTEVRLPSLSYLKPGLIRRIRRLGDVDAMYTLLELVLPADVLAVIDDMEPDDYHVLLDAWRTHSGVNLGES